jgi:hypothetical protein
MALEVLSFIAIELRGQSIGVNPDDTKINNWAGKESEPLPAGNGQHGQKTRPVVPQLQVALLNKSLDTAKNLRDVANEPITLVASSGVRVLCPGCTFASGGDLGDDYLTVTYTLGGDPIQL